MQDTIYCIPVFGDMLRITSYCRLPASRYNSYMQPGTLTSVRFSIGCMSSIFLSESLTSSAASKLQQQQYGTASSATNIFTYKHMTKIEKMKKKEQKNNIIIIIVKSLRTVLRCSTLCNTCKEPNTTVATIGRRPRQTQDTGPLHYLLGTERHVVLRKRVKCWTFFSPRLYNVCIALRARRSDN